jgi:hypothetical protein
MSAEDQTTDNLPILIGHSHVAAIAEAACSVQVSLDVISFWQEPDALRRTGSHLDFRASLFDRLAFAPYVLSAIGGGAHSVLGLVEHPEPFDFVLPTAPDLPLDTGRRLIPIDGMYAAVAEQNAEYEEILRLLVRTAKVVVAHLEPPPPLADADLIRPFVPWALFPDQPREVTPRWVRYKIWRLQCEWTAKTCGKLGVRYVPCPADGMTQDGFLHPDLTHDGIHANGGYGRLVLQQLGLVH